MDKSPSTKDDWTKGFDRLLEWLDPDRSRAGEKYEEIRQSIVKLFLWRGCSDAEELADETINRVVRRLPEIVDQYVGDPRRYFYGVSRNILLEQRRKVRSRDPRPAEDHSEIIEHYDEDNTTDLMYDCLDKCLLTLDPERRELVLQYYNMAKQKGRNRQKDVAAELGVRPAQLRASLHKIRTTLAKCIERCMEDGTSVRE